MTSLLCLCGLLLAAEPVHFELEGNELKVPGPVMFENGSSKSKDQSYDVIACERLLAVGFGETKPIAPNDSVEGRAQNRRTVFANAALKGRPIGGLPVDGGGKVASDSCAVKK